MSVVLRWLLRITAGIFLLAAGLFVVAWVVSERQLARVYAVDDPPLAINRDRETLAHGAHLYVTRGCADCHGADGGGMEVLDAPGVMRLVAPNITSAVLRSRYDADAIAAAIRHGVKPDGRPLFFMPSWDWQHLSDADTAALVAHVQSLPGSRHDPGRYEIRPLARVLTLFGQFPLTPADRIDHSPRRREAPTVAVSVEYGRYLTGTCIGCHGADLAGQRVPGTPPDIPQPARHLRCAWCVDRSGLRPRPARRPRARRPRVPSDHAVARARADDRHRDQGVVGVSADAGVRREGKSAVEPAHGRRPVAMQYRRIAAVAAPTPGSRPQ
ncbi:MAG TPA: cytochrome c [Xanthomonadaceae bacterium]|nr:cytochrome c [Xanthomonadaceae bacterium]